jgi:hypothetical protein
MNTKQIKRFIQDYIEKIIVMLDNLLSFFKTF